MFHMPNTDIHTISPFPLGQDNLDYAQYFTGKSWLAELNLKEVAIHNVTFEAGCRNDWHIHHGTGQILICVGGHGWYQEEGQTARALKEGDVVYIAPEINHWHGAATDSAFAHLSLMVLGKEGSGTTWGDRVEDQDYPKLNWEENHILATKESASQEKVYSHEEVWNELGF